VVSGGDPPGRVAVGRGAAAATAAPAAHRVGVSAEHTAGSHAGIDASSAAGSRSVHTARDARPTAPPASSQLTSAAISRGGPGATGALRLAVNRSLLAAAATSPSGPPGNPAAKTAVVNVQAFLGTQLSSLAWAAQSSTVSGDLRAVTAIDNTHVW